MQYVKLVITFVSRIIFKFIHVFPVCENLIVFTSHRGKQYSCNPKYIFEYIYKNYGSKYQYVWCLNKKNLFPDEYKNVKIVSSFSLIYIWYVLISKYYISNLPIEPFYPTRKKQIIINTWHGGGAYKKASILSPINKKQKQYMKILQGIRAKQISYIIAACKKFKTCLSKDWETPEEKFLETGMPRNDILFLKYSFREKITGIYHISNDKKIVLYAPTFRGLSYSSELFNFTLNTEDLIKHLYEKFKYEFVLLYRGHHYFNHEYIPNEIINVSDYSEMQELLCVADILITDYSSSMWDFSLTFKPCFIYAPDLEKYQNEQGFYTPIEEWPFPVAQTNKELNQNITQFDIEKYTKALKKHHDDLGSYETGTATKQFCEKIFS